MEAILQLDGAKTVQQITSLESHTPSMVTPSSATALDRDAPSSGVKGSQDASSGVSGVSGVSGLVPGDQVVSGLLPRTTGSYLDSLASQAAGVGQR